MLLAIVAISVAAGMMAAAVAVAVGGSWLVALGAYSAIGAITMLVGMVVLPNCARPRTPQNRPSKLGALETR